MKKITYKKVKARLWAELVKRMRKSRLYPLIYRSYWHSLMKRRCTGGDMSRLYYAARPNPGAGIGHQMANWIAGYFYAREFGLKFAHLPFSTPQWEAFLGLGEDEVSVVELKQKGWKIRKLPLFQDGNEVEKSLNRGIIASYAGRKVVFVAEQDQFYKAQFGVMDDIQRKFRSARARKGEHLVYDPKCFNIAIHVRRGDIMDPKSSQYSKRVLSNKYFERVLAGVVAHVPSEKPVEIYFFSQGSRQQFSEFESFEHLHWCFDMDAQSSFLHMVYADLLITSRSSFSYKPALLNRGIKICPPKFWHGYPDASDWIVCEEDGSFDIAKLEELKDKCS